MVNPSKVVFIITDLATPLKAEPLISLNRLSSIMTFPLLSIPLEVDMTPGEVMDVNVEFTICRFPPSRKIIASVYSLSVTSNLMFLIVRLPHSSILKTLFAFDLTIVASPSPIIVRFLLMHTLEFAGFLLIPPSMQIVFPLPALETAYCSVRNGFSKLPSSVPSCPSGDTK